MANVKENRLYQKTRQALQEAYLDLLNEKPAHKITVTEICRRAEVSRPAFYAHFQTKDDIILEYVEAFLKIIFQEFDALEICTDNEKTVPLIRLFFKTWQENAEIYELLQKTNLFNHVKNAYMQKQFQQIMQRLGQKYPKVNESTVKFLMTNALGGIFSVLELWMAEGMIRSVDEIVELIEIGRRQIPDEETLAGLIVVA